jgi:tetratricopeptide (TPR) repeat protein
MFRSRQQPASSATGANERWQAAAVCLGLAALTFAVFGQTLWHDFINYDDNGYVYANPVVARGLTLQGLAWAFSFHEDNWHPLTWLSHELDCQCYGLRPGGHHLSNVLLHAATVVLLFLVLRQMTGALWRSAFVAAVFAIHPLRVESVAWVAERKDVLSGFFFMLTLWAYLRHVKIINYQLSIINCYYVLALVFFSLGLMCKPMLVTLPLVLLLLDYWPLRRTLSAARMAAEKAPFLALSAACCVATLLAQHHAMQSAGLFPFPTRVGNALASGLVYVGQMFWPARLALFYPYPHDDLPAWEAALAGLLLAGISALAWWRRREQPWLLVGWLWYGLMLLPVIGIIQVGAEAHADRYTYLPQIGLYVAVTWLAAEWGARHPAARVIFGGLMAGVIAVLAFFAWQQTGYWKDSVTLWSRSLACTRSNETAHYNLANALLHEGSTDEAILHYEQALQLRPYYTDAHVNLANILLQKGQLDKAIAHYDQALDIRPNSAEFHVNLGLALAAKGKTDQAILHYQQALELRPDYVKARINLANAFVQRNNLAQAADQYQQALQVKPDSVEAQVNLGAVLVRLGRMGEAMPHFQKALQLKPDDAAIQNDLAWLLATCPQASLRDGRKAVELAQRANELSGGKNPIYLHTLAAALAESGRFGDAIQNVQKAIDLAQAAGQKPVVALLNDDLAHYQAGRPLHD